MSDPYHCTLYTVYSSNSLPGRRLTAVWIEVVGVLYMHVHTHALDGLWSLV
jgi:hypothetical protein